MKNWLAVLLIAALSPTGVFAQAQHAQTIEDVADSNVWRAVGRLDVAGRGVCTAALIAPDVVLTAAHCLFNKSTGLRIDHGSIDFLAGWENGSATARRAVSRAVIHPDYVFGSKMTPKRVRSDIALLKLDRPIKATSITPFSTTQQPDSGDHVGVVSYVPKQAAAPSPQAGCNVLKSPHGVLVTSCSVDFGASGSPIFTVTDGKPQIVSVVSAKARMNGSNVALGTGLGGPLNSLQSELAAGKGVFESSGRILAGLSTGQTRGVFNR